LALPTIPINMIAVLIIFTLIIFVFTN